MLTFDAPLPDAPTAVVLDEDAEVTQYVAYVLQRLGFAVRRFAAGSEALPHVREAVPSVLVINSSLADMDGLAFLRDVRDADVLREVPVVFMSSTGTTSLREEVQALRADAFLQKPFGKQPLADAVAQAVRQGAS
jgi:FixJ family two-component response regulator